MKKLKLILILLLFFIPISANCQAAVSEDAIKLAKIVLNGTDDFEKPIVEGNYDEAKRLSDEYEIVSNKLKTFLNENKNLYYEDYDCVRMTASIVNLRCLMLIDYVIAVQVYQKNGKSAFYDEMIAEMYSDWREAKSERQQFYNKYGF